MRPSSLQVGWWVLSLDGGRRYLSGRSSGRKARMNKTVNMEHICGVGYGKKGIRSPVARALCRKMQHVGEDDDQDICGRIRALYFDLFPLSYQRSTSAR